MPAAGTHPTFVHTRKLHVERNKRNRYPEIQDDPELAAAYHSLQLHWLASVPGYREAIKQKLSEAAIAAERRAMKIEVGQRTVDGTRLSQVLKMKEREEQLERLAGY